MARPPKESIDYFSHDNTMRNDDKIKAVRRKFSLEGYAIWCMILEKLCESKTQRIPYNDMSIEIISGDFEIDPVKLKEIIDYFLKVDLLQTDNDFFFSQELLERVRPLMWKRQRQAAWAKGEERLSTHYRHVSDVEIGSKVKESKVKESICISHGSDQPDFDFFFKNWNDKIKTNCILKLNTHRKQKIKARVENDKDFKDKFLKCIDLITESDFLSGRSSKWCATFDWLIENDTNYLKVLEGNYKNKSGGQNGNTGYSVGVSKAEYQSLSAGRS